MMTKTERAQRKIDRIASAARMAADYAVLTKDGTFWEFQTTDLKEAIAHYDTLKSTTHVILIQIILDSEDDQTDNK